MSPRIAVVGMACEFPDARSPQELWELVLAQRRAFRALPACRLRSADYLAADRTTPDATYVLQAAVLDGWEFDRARFQVTSTAFRSADLAHWLALDVAARALADAGFPAGRGLDGATTGVLLGNTLTGEFSRAATLRLRWPYVRRVLEERVADLGLSGDAARQWLAAVHARFVAPFAPVNEETLAGGLSNTIAGRICNHFDFKGGGFTVDGACSSSLLAVAQACSALAAGDLEVALAGGVDLSLDPFELVGFAKAGALAPEMMRVYDARGAGFWPGEGCGFVVLMREEDARRRGLPIHACLAGWGISSDGAGGITRPEADGQRLALTRAWRRAGIGIEQAAAFEGHGTGTAVGDRTELSVLLSARRAGGGRVPAALSSIKANLGHTKAAAGIAGLLKAVLAARARLLPPATGWDTPHELLVSGDAPQHLRLLRAPEPWRDDAPLHIGVSAMGFGGINTHVVVSSTTSARARALAPDEALLARTAQDVELFLFAAPDAQGLQAQLNELAARAPELSLAELGDVAADFARRLQPGSARAAVVAATPGELVHGLQQAAAALAQAQDLFDPHGGVFAGTMQGPPRIGYLFPGQGVPAQRSGGALRRRFAAADAVYLRAEELGVLASHGGDSNTEVAQPALAIAALAGREVLAEFGIVAQAALGHSFGELPALCWAGALTPEQLLRLAAVRGRAMAELTTARGSMASFVATPEALAGLLGSNGNGHSVTIAAENASDHTVVSGEASAVADLLQRARKQRIAGTALPVAHAFHSPLVAPAAAVLRRHFAHDAPGHVRATVFSTITGARLPQDADVAELLALQVTTPVRFRQAAEAARAAIDLWLEVGPGQTTSQLMQRAGHARCVALDCGGPSLRGLCTGIGAAFVLGASVRAERLAAGRFTRPFVLTRPRRFLANPCEEAPALSPAVASGSMAAVALSPAPASVAPVAPDGAATSPRAVLLELIAAHAETAVATLHDTQRLLGDLHLNSITVGQIAATAARRLGLPPPLSPTEFAGATVGGLVQAFATMRRAAPAPPEHAPHHPAGIAPWVRAFAVEWTSQLLPLLEPGPGGAGLVTVVAAPGDAFAAALGAALQARALGDAASHTVLVCLPRIGPVESLLLSGVRAVTGDGATRLLIVHEGRAAAGFARALFLEEKVVTAVIDVPRAHPQAIAWVCAEGAAARGCHEVRYDAEGRRHEPRLRVLDLTPAAGAAALGPNDVLVVTGGGKGIAAECAFDLGQRTGARLALLGRATPETDRELAANLARMRAAGVACDYFVADVTDLAAVGAALRGITARCGVPTAVLHGAGRNEPIRTRDLDAVTFRATCAPKVDGLHHLLAHCHPARLRLVVAFGSVIARTGLHGEADYAHANEEMRRALTAWQATHAHCRVLTLEWSVWSGTGMGERLGRIDALLREGITPIPIDAGVRVLRELLATPNLPPSVVVAGRLGDLPTAQWADRELPLLRYLERVRAHTPRVELVTDTELSHGRDPYLADHQLDHDALFPAVLGLEAMAQAHRALGGEPDAPHGLGFTDVEFARPIVVPEADPMALRVAALRHNDGAVEVALRCATTSFAADHFRARVQALPTRAPWAAPVAAAGDIELVPEQDLYGEVCFQGPRFQRVRRYLALTARSCRVELASTPTTWFQSVLPGDLLLGDPGVRDAALHAISACIPHRRLLPLRVARIFGGVLTSRGPFVAQAIERRHEGDIFEYDLSLADAGGREVERWEGLQFKAVAARTLRAWPPALLATYLERRVEEVTGVRLGSVQLGTVTRALATVTHRLDGKPERGFGPAADGSHRARAHAAGLDLTVTAPCPIGCDLEPAAPRPLAHWRDLLAPAQLDLAHLLARECNEPIDRSATRVWNVIECAKKAGLPEPFLPAFAQAWPDGCVLLRAGDVRIASVVPTVKGVPNPLALAVLVSQHAAT